MQKIKLVVVACSGAGKTTLLNKFLLNNNDFELSISYTTRQPRHNEIIQDEYVFVNNNDFLQKASENFFFETEFVFNSWYGTPTSFIESPENVIFNVDYKGALKIKSAIAHAITIFILPPSFKELENRLKLRQEPEIEKRLSRVPEELSKYHLFDFILINDKIDDTYNKMLNIINFYKHKHEAISVINNFFN